jgi:hypothetical protein
LRYFGIELEVIFCRSIQPLGFKQTALNDLKMEDTTGYDKVSDLIGKTINDAFMDLFDKLTTGDMANFAASGITQADVDNFFTTLGGANVAVQFAPKVIKGTKDKFAAKEY